ncbi:irregular chiasm C-roughest protein-like isoform X2 [Cimex lectularius]|uniref:Ig-like domain-containing protein n=1 Tax=Cimex lectularius TaxID=79782 RepID=A0A8I6STV5_CIMLE|nr:irregular chiasm C-roughest protein-like isoform X2 [Cimex lectularius]
MLAVTVLAPLRLDGLTVLEISIGPEMKQLLPFLFLIHCILCEQKFAIEPQDQTATVGSRVTLPCRVLGKVGRIQWTKDDFGLGEHRSLQGYDRYNMIGSDDEGDFSLEIYPVILDDDAQYQCQVGPGQNGEEGIRSRFAHLTVYTPPEPPKIVQGEKLLTTEDREIELECVSLAGKPPAEITWIDGLGNVIKEGIEYIVDEMPDGRRYNARSILKLTPKKEHHNTTFVCQAQNQAERTYRNAKLRLEVKYAPKVTVSVIGGATRLTEGVDVRLKCSADANPPDVTYRWYINDRLVETDATTELHLVNVTRRQHDSIVKCEVQNAVGKSEESETLDISYGPRFRKKPHSIQADQGSTITLTCDVDGNPQPDIVWHHESTNRVAGTSANLSLNVNSETAGRYYCKATVIGFPEIGAEAVVYVKGPPQIISHRSQFGVPGDNARVDCTAYSVPPQTKVLWSFKGEDITADNSHEYSVLEDPLSEGVKSTLIIRESRQDHFGIYNCTVVNAYGHDTLEITLKPQKSFPLLLILTGVLGGIVIIIAITMVIILCQRKVKKPPTFTTNEQTDVEKQCKESDRSSNISDIKLELRTGSSVSNVHCELDYPGGGGSETGSESVVTRIGVPLAGPVPIDHRYSNNRFSSGDYPDPVFPPKNDGQNNNGYVPYVDYTRDYTPPAPTTMATSTSPGVDPRYSAVYGNPYLRTTGTPTLPPPPPLAPAPPPYSARNGSIPHRPSNTSHYITSQQAVVKRGSLATHV